jgi:hypothetical protein
MQHGAMRQALLGALLLATFAHAVPKVGWVRASGQLEAGTPSHYSPLNLLDGNPATVWCSRDADALKETLTFGFAEPVTLTRLEVTTGNAGSEEAFRAMSRVRKLLLRGPEATATVTLEDRRGVQSVQLEKPLRGKTFALEVLDSFSAEDPLAPVCLADVVPFAGASPLAGPVLRKRLAFQPGRAELLGLWYGGPEGAPDRTLTFFLDGTWRSLPEGASGRGKPLSGKWWVKAGQLWLTVPGAGKVQGGALLSVQKDASGKALGTLSLEGPVGPLKQTFRDRR